MVLEEYESNGNRWRVRERMKWIVRKSDQTHRYYRLLPVMQKFVWTSLDDKELVIVGYAILGHASGKQEEINAAPVFIELPRSSSS